MYNKWYIYFPIQSFYCKHVCSKIIFSSFVSTSCCPSWSDEVVFKQFHTHLDSDLALDKHLPFCCLATPEVFLTLCWLAAEGEAVFLSTEAILAKLDSKIRRFWGTCFQKCVIQGLCFLSSDCFKEWKWQIKGKMKQEFLSIKIWLIFE